MEAYSKVGHTLQNAFGVPYTPHCHNGTMHTWFWQIVRVGIYKSVYKLRRLLSLKSQIKSVLLPLGWTHSCMHYLILNIFILVILNIVPWFSHPIDLLFDGAPNFSPIPKDCTIFFLARIHGCKHHFLIWAHLLLCGILCKAFGKQLQQLFLFLFWPPLSCRCTVPNRDLFT